MNIRRTVKLLAVAGAVSMVPGLASAAEPVGNKFNITGAGVVVEVTGSPCLTTFTCVTDIVETNFLQQSITDGTDSYVRTITGGGGLKSETFVKTNAGNPASNQGIKAYQSVNGTENVVQLEMGWANAGHLLENEIQLTGQMSDVGYFAEYTILLDQENVPNSNNVIGKSLDIFTETQLGMNVALSDANHVDFDHRRRSGTLLTGGATDDSVTIGSAPLGGTITFDGTDTVNGDVMVTWLGQNIDGSSADQQFGFEKFTDNNAATSVEAFSLITAKPVDWAAPTQQPGSGNDIGTSSLNNIFGATPWMAGVTFK